MRDLWRVIKCHGCGTPVAVKARATRFCETCRHISKAETKLAKRKKELLALVDGATRDACIEWPWRKTQDGYGRASWRKKDLNAHRLIFMLLHGEDEMPPMVMHSCDNKPCINPHHLIAGNASQNTLDAWRRGRVLNPAQGERQHAAKLTEAAVKDIRASPETGRSLSAKYGVTPSVISVVRNGKTWKHVS